MKLAHVVIRTSPKGEGQKFIGSCAICGRDGLSASAALEQCPGNPAMTPDQAWKIALEGPRQ